MDKIKELEEKITKVEDIWSDSWAKLANSYLRIKETLQEHLKAHIRVAEDQLNPAINKVELFNWFDKEIKKQLHKLDFLFEDEKKINKKRNENYE